MSTINTTNLKNPSSGSNNVVLNADGSATIATLTGTTITGTSVRGGITSGTAVASTSGTSIDFTGIPAWVKRVTVMFDAVSTNGTSLVGVAVGTSSGFVSTGYEGGASNQNATYVANTNCLLINASSLASFANRGHAILTLISTNRWIFSAGVQAGLGNLAGAGGAITLSGTLDRVRITTVNGTDTFDAGTINILYEG
jgi:hypothetical protein